MTNQVKLDGYREQRITSVGRDSGFEKRKWFTVEGAGFNKEQWWRCGLWGRKEESRGRKIPKGFAGDIVAAIVSRKGG